MNQQSTTVLTVNKTSMLTASCQHSRIFHEWRITSVAVNKPRCVGFHTFPHLSLTSQRFFLGIKEILWILLDYAVKFQQIKKKKTCDRLDAKGNQQKNWVVYMYIYPFTLSVLNIFLYITWVFLLHLFVVWLICNLCSFWSFGLSYLQLWIEHIFVGTNN